MTELAAAFAAVVTALDRSGLDYVWTWATELGVIDDMAELLGKEPPGTK